MIGNRKFSRHLHNQVHCLRQQELTHHIEFIVVEQTPETYVLSWNYRVPAYVGISQVFTEISGAPSAQRSKEPPRKWGGSSVNLAPEFLGTSRLENGGKDG